MADMVRKFWKIIDSTNVGRNPDRRSQVEKIADILQLLSFDELASFKRQLNAALAKSYTFDLIVASFVVYSRVSDDLFLEFRSWLILHGRKIFEETVANPNAIASLVSKDEVDQINCGGFPELPTRIWLGRGGGLKAYVAKAGFIVNPVVKKNWPKDKQEFQERYPVLYNAFWNTARIKALNKP